MESSPTRRRVRVDGYSSTGTSNEQHTTAALFVSAARARKAPEWITDADITGCMLCEKQFGVFSRKHHCRSCGWAVCAGCSENALVLDRWLEAEKPHALREDRRSDAPLRVCNMCHVALGDLARREPASDAELERNAQEERATAVEELYREIPPASAGRIQNMPTKSTVPSVWRACSCLLQ